MSLTDQLRDSLPDAILKSAKREREMYVQRQAALADLYEAETGHRLPEDVTFYAEDGTHYRLQLQPHFELFLIARPEYVQDENPVG